jgi:hypothetical protein
MNNKIILSSLAMDLKRVALGFHRNSKKMAKRFLEEAIKRKNEIDPNELLPYMRSVINKVGLLPNFDDAKKAEDALMYSVLIQNYVLHKL